jgi:WD40 repeat protein
VGVTPTFDREGRLMATADEGGIAVNHLRSGRPSGRRRHYTSPGAVGVSMSPDGRTLAVAMVDGGVDIVDVPTLRRRAMLSGPGTAPVAVQFSPDGRWLAAGGLSGWVRAWSTKTWRPASSGFQLQTGGAHRLAFSPDGALLAAGGFGGTIQLFDLDSQRPFGTPLPGVPDGMTAPAFTPDGYLLSITDAGRAYRWDLRPAAWARHACAVAGRRLTRAEWDEVLPGRDYTSAC